jgi:hypothetical protein
MPKRLTKLCSRCKTKKPATLEYFAPNIRHRDKLSSQCRVCKREHNRKYNKTDSRKVAIQKYRITISGHLQNIYTNIWRRCNISTAAGYKYYGGRGIKCRFTLNEFRDYVINILQINPKGLRCHRINNNGHYELENIEFLTDAKHKERHKNAAKIK